MGCTHHNGVAVYGSGFCIGQNANISGPFGLGSDRSGAKDSFMGPAGVDGWVRWDAGTINLSSNGICNGASTRLSSIALVVANPTGTAQVSGLLAVYTDWSGGAIDIYGFGVNASGKPMAPVTGAVAWLALGK